jgi:streptomycin 6-kinase
LDALEATRDRLVVRFGDAVVGRWWQALPALLADLAARWELTVGEAAGRGNTSLVLRCTRADGRAAVLKLCPEAAITAAEARALRLWQPTGRVPAVWESAAGALLLEAVRDERPRSIAVDAVAPMIRALHVAPVAGFPSLGERVAFIFDHFALAGREAALALAADAVAPSVLHGDLHPGNVLDTERGLVAIDPRPCVGDPAFDVIDWVFHGDADAATWAAATGCDAGRLARWCEAFAAFRPRRPPAAPSAGA